MSGPVALPTAFTERLGCRLPVQQAPTGPVSPTVITHLCDGAESLLRRRGASSRR